MPPRSLPGEGIFEKMPVPVAITDEEHVLWVNVAMQTLLGYSERHALIGSPLTAMVLPGKSAQEER